MSTFTMVRLQASTCRGEFLHCSMATFKLVKDQVISSTILQQQCNYTVIRGVKSLYYSEWTCWIWFPPVICTWNNMLTTLFNRADVHNVNIFDCLHWISSNCITTKVEPASRFNVFCHMCLIMSAPVLSQQNGPFQMNEGATFFSIFCSAVACLNAA